jgi:hypothetical protein
MAVGDGDNRSLDLQHQIMTPIMSPLQEFQKELQSTEDDAGAAAGNAAQKLKDHPQAGEGEGVRDLE